MKITTAMVDAFRTARDNAHCYVGLYRQIEEGHRFTIVGEFNQTLHSFTTPDYAFGHKLMMAELNRLRDESALRGALAAAEPAGWFVKDFADGFIFFDDEEKARAEAADTGALVLVAYKEGP
jgi:hypothetical protein